MVRGGMVVMDVYALLGREFVVAAGAGVCGWGHRHADPQRTGVSARKGTPAEPFMPVLVTVMEWGILTALLQANPSSYLTSSLGITFPFNLVFGLPLYYQFAVWLA